MRSFDMTPNVQRRLSLQSPAVADLIFVRPMALTRASILLLTFAYLVRSQGARTNKSFFLYAVFQT
jgi:hypothetical protein